MNKLQWAQFRPQCLPLRIIAATQYGLELCPAMAPLSSGTAVLYCHLVHRSSCRHHLDGREGSGPELDATSTAPARVHASPETVAHWTASVAAFLRWALRNSLSVPTVPIKISTTWASWTATMWECRLKARAEPETARGPVVWLIWTRTARRSCR